MHFDLVGQNVFYNCCDLENPLHLLLLSIIQYVSMVEFLITFSSCSENVYASVRFVFSFPLPFASAFFSMRLPTEYERNGRYEGSR